VLLHLNTNPAHFSIVILWKANCWLNWTARVATGRPCTCPAACVIYLSCFLHYINVLLQYTYNISQVCLTWNTEHYANHTSYTVTQHILLVLLGKIQHCPCKYNYLNSHNHHKHLQSSNTLIQQIFAQNVRLHLRIVQLTVKTGDICHCRRQCFSTLSSADCSLPGCSKYSSILILHQCCTNFSAKGAT